MNKKLLKSKKFIYISALIFIVLFSVGYSALQSSLSIVGDTRYNRKFPVRITGIELVNASNSGTEQFNPNYNYNSTTTGVNLPNLDSTVTYAVTVHNYQSFDVQGLFEISNNSNSDIIFVLGLESDLDEIIYAESDSTFYIIIRYDPNITVLPNITSDNMTISFSYNGITMFKPGNSVNETMNVISSWSGSGADSITRIARYKGNSIPNSLTDYNIVSTISSEHPIYMWYDDGTIYWYSEAEHIYYNFDAGSMFRELPNVQGIYDMNDIYSIYTENMEFMFYRLGSTASTFDLDLGDNFYTKNVYSMNSMFQGMASYCLTYGGIDLGPNFDTSKVTQMNDMFSHIRVYTIHAPTTFVTTNVVASNNMFYDDTRLVGGAGTQYTPSHVDALYAHIDEGTSNPGYFTNRKTAMFKSGKEVNARMKQFVNSSATYESEDTTIQKILKVPQQPAPQYLISENIVSTPDSQYPIYMWYTPGSSSGWLTNPSIVNWWTEADLVFYNPDSSFFYYNLFALDDITECWFFNSKYVTNMSYMFSHTGYNSTSFTLDLGDRFDTSKVTNMYGMFEYTGRNSTSFTLDLGDKFDTGNVTNMYQMFSNTGYKSTVLTLDLGDKFDTGNVTNMSYMFSNTGYKSTIFTLDLGDKFDTSNVTNMSYMFSSTGYNSTVLTLDLGDKFDTSNVTTMTSMFFYTGKSSTVLTLDLGDKFDTSNVTNMSSMFLSTGSGSTVFTLDLGDKFDTSKVTDMSDMFTNTGYSSTVFTLDLGDKFDTSNVTNMSYMFENTGRNSTVFTLDLGDKFDTSKVTNMYSMFHLTGRNSTVFTLDLGDKFDTSNVTNMSDMFNLTSYSNATFTLDLGNKFDTSNVTDMSGMFSDIGYSSSVFTLDLGDKFDTSNVTSMSSMFSYTGYSNATFTLDLGDKFDTSKVTDMSYMFQQFKGTTIYAPSSFVTTHVTSSTNMFDGCTNLVGGAGTVFDSSHINASYAHIDGGTSNPGYFSNRFTAVFKTGEEVNVKMKQFINSSASYSSKDTTITDIARYMGTPNSSYLIDSNIVSDSNSEYPIYMWYDSTNTTIYWYTVAARVYYNVNSSRFYNELRALNSISGLKYISSENTTNMSSMFGSAGREGTNFTLDLGDKFDTSNVTNMTNLFFFTGYANTSFTLNLGPKFDTSKVTNMTQMFSSTGYNSTIITLNLGDKFDTSNVTNMQGMFNKLGYNNTSFTLDLGDKFDTSKVTNMRSMFSLTGRSSTTFNLDLGDKFDTSNVTDMYFMFADMGQYNYNQVLNLGLKFNTSKVTNMTNMFASFWGKTIYAPSTFVTTNVTSSSGMFDSCDYLVGGSGTLWDSNNTDKTYARIDGGPTSPGYFTAAS